MALLKSPWLHGLHEGHEENGLQHYLNKPSWIVFTEGIGHDPSNRSGGDYRQWTEKGYWPIVRLNNGYEPEGTIPHRDNFEKFAQRCQNFVSASKGDVWYWIIGNEPNGRWERPHGWAISPEDYVRCYLMCRKAIKEIKPGVVVLLAPVAMWNVDTGDWVAYFKQVSGLVEGNCDGFALHTYSHGSDPALITSESKMDAPYQDRIYNFRAYQDLMRVIPQSMRSLPVLFTEADQDEPWLDQPNTWIQEAYREISRWNQNPQNQTIQALIMYRWPRRDRWVMAGKQNVVNDFRAAVRLGYLSAEPRSFKAQPPKPDKPDSPPIGKGVVTASMLNVRNEGRLTGEIVGTVGNGETVNIYEENGSWLRIGVDRWVHGDWVQREGNVPSPGNGKEDWPRAIEWVLQWEGGLSMNPEDHGNWTGGRKGQGELRGTNFGISAASYPRLDIRNLTREQAIAIYERDYWQSSGAASLPYPLSLLVLDTAVLHGVGTAKKWLKEVGTNPYAFAARRLHTYTKLDNWHVFGAAWTNRTADLLEEMAK